MSRHSPWFEMPSPFENESGTVMLLEPPWSRPGELRARLLDESYARPFVIDDGERRFLYFNVRLMQSAMRLRAPDELDLRYTQKMMSFLLFLPRPKHIVLIGMGGGSLLKFCHRYLGQARVTAVELDPDVIAWREAFMVPPDGPRLQVVQGDGAAFLALPENGMDVLLVDAFDAAGFAPGLASREFFETVHARLAGNGVLVVNLAGERELYAGLVAEVLQVFDDQAIVFSVPEDGNHILLAFKDRYFEPRWRLLQQQAKELRARYGLDFPAFLQKIERSAKLGLARRSR